MTIAANSFDLDFNDPLDPQLVLVGVDDDGVHRAIADIALSDYTGPGPVSRLINADPTSFQLNWPDGSPIAGYGPLQSSLSAAAVPERSSLLTGTIGLILLAAVTQVRRIGSRARSR